MISTSIYEDSIDSSSSSIIIYDNYSRRSLLLSCFSCSRTYKAVQSSLRTVENTSSNQREKFFKRIQFYKGLNMNNSKNLYSVHLKVKHNFRILLKINDFYFFHSILSLARKRQGSTRQLQPQIASNQLTDDHVNETNNNDAESSSNFHPDLFTNYPIRNSSSIPLFNRLNPSIGKINYSIDSLSDIETVSSNNEKVPVPRTGTSKRSILDNFSLTTTNISTHSTQSLLRKLLDKAQVLDLYYNSIVNKTTYQRLTLQSLSSNSLLGQSSVTSHSYLYRSHSNESIKRLQRRKCHHLYDNISSDSSRFNLYVDEDNILRELIRFNNDMSLILSRLEMNGENLEQQTSDIDENPNQQTIISSTADSTFKSHSQNHDQ